MPAFKLRSLLITIAGDCVLTVYQAGHSVAQVALTETPTGAVITHVSQREKKMHIVVKYLSLNHTACVWLGLDEG